MRLVNRSGRPVVLVSPTGKHQRLDPLGCSALVARPADVLFTFAIDGVPVPIEAPRGLVATPWIYPPQPGLLQLVDPETAAATAHHGRGDVVTWSQWDKVGDALYVYKLRCPLTRPDGAVCARCHHPYHPQNLCLERASSGSTHGCGCVGAEPRSVPGGGW